MPHTVTADPTSTLAVPAIVPLENVLALHRDLISARARLPDPDSFLSDVLETLRFHLNAAGGLICLCDSATRTLSQIIASGAAPALSTGSDPDSRLPCFCRVIGDDRDAVALAWIREATAGAGRETLAAAALLVGGEEIGLVALFGPPRSRPTPWQHEGLASAAMEIALAVAHLRLRRGVEDRLRERNERWSALYETALSLTSLTDGGRLLEELALRAIRLLRARGGSLSVRDEATGETVVVVAYMDGARLDALSGHRMPPGDGLAARVLETGQTLRVSSVELAAHPNPHENRASVIAAPLFVQNAPIGVLVVADDPSARVFTDEDVQTVELFAQAAGAALERAHGRQQERSLTIYRERARLARELHDGLAQNLASLLLKAELCQDIARETQPALARQIDLLAEGIQQAVRETRAAIATLREAPSDGQRLMDALSLLASRFESQTRIPVALSWEGDANRSLPDSAHMALLRVAQEALANVRKHACAQNVCAHLNASDPKTLKLSVHDDGCGFSVPLIDASQDQEHFGLRGMRERMEELDGSLLIDTAPGCGTTITAILPIRERRQ
jgi:signal transduction histidine kinase